MSDFEEQLVYYMHREGLTVRELANKLKLAESTISRWCNGLTQPHASTVHKLSDVLSMSPEENASFIQLLDKRLKPKVEASLTPALLDDSRLAISDSRFYVYRYSKERIPSLWSQRTVELEGNLVGPEDVIFNGFPPMIRVPEIYTLYAREDRYELVKVEEYIALARNRQESFQRRLERYPVRHIYSKKAILDQLLSGYWRSMPIDKELQLKQLSFIVRLLQDNPKFEVGLSNDLLPLDAVILAHKLALIDFLHVSKPSLIGNVSGLETTMPEIVLLLQQQFESLWAGESVSITTNKAEIENWLSGGWLDEARKLMNEWRENLDTWDIMTR